jgi:GTP pyrophosphokinase
MIKIEEIIKKAKEYLKELDEAKVIKAYESASMSHKGQKRLSGEPYISHPLNVAYIVADLRLDETSIIAALLHDVIEDTGYTSESIKAEFGEPIAIIVEGLTRINKLDFQSSMEEQAENLRKMLIAMSNDIRIILIKLADRLHNMRTLSNLDPGKRIEKSKETLDIYAPIAHRLGMSKLKSEFEDLAFLYMNPNQYEEVKQLVAENQMERKELTDQIISKISQELKAVGIEAEIISREKHLYSVYQKIAKQGRTFSDIYDLSAIRVIVDSVKECYGALGIIHSIWKPLPGRFKDFIANPKFNMYQSLHTTIIGPMGMPVEIQIRTWQMHRTAEYGIAAHWRYKEGKKGDEKFDEKLAWLRQILEWQQELSDPKEFMESLKLDLFEDEVFVFTPKGKVLNLPFGSTPVDFAYMIHSDVGNQCVGAKVNHRIVPLEYKLRSGDIVEIITSKSSLGPSRDWLSFIKTARTRNKIKQWFSAEERKFSQNIGREMLSKTLRKQGLSLQNLNMEILENVALEVNCDKVEKLYQSIGAGKISPHMVTTKIIKEKNKTTNVEEVKETESIEEYVLPVRTRFTRGIKVRGLDEVLIKLARCCNPVPGDKVIGYVTRGQGVSVHRRDCTNLKSLISDSERLIEVEWNLEQPSIFQVEIQVEALDRTKLLRDITNVFAEYDINIVSSSANLKEKVGVMIARFVLEIGNLLLLDNLLSSIKKIDSVFDAFRVTPEKESFKSNNKITS